MSKLLDLLAQQKALVEQIERLQKDENEAKVFKVVEELEALREKYGYEQADFVSVVLSYYQPGTPAKKTKGGSSKAPAEKKPQYKVKVDGVELVLKESTRGIMKEDLEKAVKQAGFDKYSDYLTDLMKKNEVSTFDALIDKLGGVAV